jgi:hypothetical protein
MVNTTIRMVCWFIISLSVTCSISLMLLVKKKKEEEVDINHTKAAPNIEPRYLLHQRISLC